MFGKKVDHAFKLSQIERHGVDFLIHVAGEMFPRKGQYHLVAGDDAPEVPPMRPRTLDLMGPHKLLCRGPAVDDFDNFAVVSAARFKLQPSLFRNSANESVQDRFTGLHGLGNKFPVVGCRFSGFFDEQNFAVADYGNNYDCSVNNLGSLAMLHDAPPRELGL